MKSYRGYSEESPMSSWGHAMFNDDATGLAAYGDVLYSVDKETLTDIWGLMEEIENKLETADAGIAEIVENWGLETLFDPADMVIDAGAYDNDLLFGWFWENIIEPNNIHGICTRNGAIVFDESVITREGIAAEIEIAQ